MFLCSPFIKDLHSLVVKAWVKSLACSQAGARISGCFFLSSDAAEARPGLEGADLHCEGCLLPAWAGAGMPRVLQITISSDGDSKCLRDGGVLKCLFSTKSVSTCSQHKGPYIPGENQAVAGAWEHGNRDLEQALEIHLNPSPSLNCSPESESSTCMVCL